MMVASEKRIATVTYGLRYSRWKDLGNSCPCFRKRCLLYENISKKSIEVIESSGGNFTIMTS